MSELGYRYYSPELGRWISRDPIWEYASRSLHIAEFAVPLAEITRLGVMRLREFLVWYGVPEAAVQGLTNASLMRIFDSLALRRERVAFLHYFRYASRTPVDVSGVLTVEDLGRASFAADVGFDSDVGALYLYVANETVQDVDYLGLATDLDCRCPYEVISYKGGWSMCHDGSVPCNMRKCQAQACEEVSMCNLVIIPAAGN